MAGLISLSIGGGLCPPLVFFFAILKTTRYCNNQRVLKLTEQASWGSSHHHHSSLYRFLVVQAFVYFHVSSFEFFIPRHIVSHLNLDHPSNFFHRNVSKTSKEEASTVPGTDTIYNDSMEKSPFSVDDSLTNFSFCT